MGSLCVVVMHIWFGVGNNNLKIWNKHLPCIASTTNVQWSIWRKMPLVTSFQHEHCTSPYGIYCKNVIEEVVPYSRSTYIRKTFHIKVNWLIMMSSNIFVHNFIYFFFSNNFLNIIFFQIYEAFIGHTKKNL